MDKYHGKPRYIRLGPTEVIGFSNKVGSTSIINKYVRNGPRLGWTEVTEDDIVTLHVRHPYDRLVSAWKWFTQHHVGYMPRILEVSESDHTVLLDSMTPFSEWVETAFKHDNLHWAPQTEIHPQWRRFNLLPLSALGGTVEKKSDHAAWEEYFDDDMLVLCSGVYAEDLIMWEEVKDAVNTGTE